MKKIALILLLSNSALATISNSNLETRFNTLLENAITKECGQMKDLTLVDTVIVEDHIDQGIVDLYYTTTLTGLQRYDQNIFDVYDITVEAEYQDAYDFSTREYGSYVIENVECNIR